MDMVKVKVLKDFKGSNYGYDVVEYKKGDNVEMTESLFDSVKEVKNVNKKGEPLPVEHWVKEVSRKKANEEETEKVSGR